MIYVNQDNYTITGDVSGDYVGQDIVKVYADANYDGVADSSTPLASVLDDPGPGDNGTFSLSVFLNQNVANHFVLTVTAPTYAESAPLAFVNITEDSIAPSVYIETPANGSLTGSENVTLHYQVSEATSTLFYVLDAGSPVALTGNDVPINYLGIGTHTIEVIATDLTTVNVGTAANTFTYDPSLPAIPTATIGSGVYNDNQTVYLQCATGNAVIYYTTNGTAPDNTKTLYTGTGILTQGDTVLKAAAYGTNNHKYSPAIEFDYIIKSSSADLYGSSSQTIALAPGWNIISVPKVVSSVVVSDNVSIFAMVAGQWYNYPQLQTYVSTNYPEAATIFVPLIGYTAYNNTGSNASITFTYAASLTSDQSFFARSFTQSGWYTVGVADPNEALTQGNNSPMNVDTSHILYPSTVISRILDYTGNRLGSTNPSTAINGYGQYIFRAFSDDTQNQINPRETRGYMVYISINNGGISGYQRIGD